MNEQALNEMKLAEVVKLVDELGNEERSWITLKIAFLRNITIDTLVPYLRLLCYGEGLKADVYMGDYDNVMQDVIDTGSRLYLYCPDVIVVALKMEHLSEKLSSDFSALDSAETSEECNRVLNFVDKVLSEIRKNSKAAVLIHNFEIPVYPAFGVLDSQDPKKQVNAFRMLNNSLLDIIGKYDSVYVIDVDLIQSTLGYLNYFDNRYWYIGRAPYTRDACRAIAQEYAKFLRALKGKNKKCLVLDCDNTLWGGIVGEDGISKIKIGTTYPGSAFRDFQKAILNLYHRGIMLAIGSKNNEDDVLEVLDEHPDMILRKKHFITMRINWKDKVSNLKEIANEINIGLDSLVFVDDSDFEINLVRRMLPEVATIKLPEDPTAYRDVLRSCGLFDTLTLSEEDRRRNEMYKAQISRKRAKAEFQSTSLEDYYRYLEMEVTIKSGDEFSIPRISQLTQKTNQFNLTTIRYSESQIREFCESNDADVRFLRLEDRFGDNGIVGVAILKYADKESVIDTFLLSCRVIGRGVEEVFLTDCINLASKRGCERIIGVYSRTPKNGQVESFYQNHAFSRIDNGGGDVTEYSFFLEKELPEFPDYFKSIQIDGKEVH